ncbi:MAG: response regulator [Chloroflexota bacterium]
MAKRVLIAEDDQDVRLMLYRLFKDRGYEVTTAKDGRDAMRCLREEGFPDVLIADHNMPGMTGLEVIQEVRKRDPDNNVKIILATATHMRTADDTRKAQGLADLMLAKPFDYDRLTQLIDRLMES